MKMSPLRKLVIGIAEYAATLKNLAKKRADLKVVYNELCDVLDALNKPLRDESDGPIKPDWEKF